MAREEWLRVGEGTAEAVPRNVIVTGGAIAVQSTELAMRAGQVKKGSRSYL